MVTRAARFLATMGAMAALGTPLGGCFATVDSVQRLERRVTTVERSDEERRRELREAVERATEQVRTLNEQLDAARRQATNLADLGARLDALESQLRAINGAIADLRTTLETRGNDLNNLRSALLNQLTEVERRVLAVERRVGIAPAIEASQVPQSPADIMAQARQAFDARDFNRARALASALIQRAPQDALADDARLLIARSHAAENRNATAIQEFQRLLTDYPSADTVPDALTDLAEAYLRLGMCPLAQRTLRMLIERHGATPQGQNARRRLREVERLPRTACTG